jgi:hypothetical protein
MNRGKGNQEQKENEARGWFGITISDRANVWLGLLWWVLLLAIIWFSYSLSFLRMVLTVLTMDFD